MLVRSHPPSQSYLLPLLLLRLFHAMRVHGLLFCGVLCISLVDGRLLCVHMLSVATRSSCVSQHNEVETGFETWRLIVLNHLTGVRRILAKEQQ